ncbi:MAG TPA: hypothetical protein VMV48_09055 [Gallionellaceae bacterium]|nr:hypothetical protein [Gallionellaceae bacterium]
MTLQDVLQELIQRLGSGGDSTLAWEQVREWPKGAIEAFQKAGWIEPTAAASSVECPGCEENCFMPVHVLPARNEQPARAYVACDRPADMGRVKIPMSRLQQWQVTESQVACWVSGALDLKGKPERDKSSRAFKLGNLQGKKQVSSLEFNTVEMVSLKVSGHSIPLSDVVIFEGDQPGIDRAAILDLVDMLQVLESSDRYKPSTARREARKLDTQAMYASWQKAYRDLHKINKIKNKTETWYSQQIEKMDIAQGRDASTIKKHMLP